MKVYLYHNKLEIYCDLQKLSYADARAGILYKLHTRGKDHVPGFNKEFIVFFKKIFTLHTVPEGGDVIIYKRTGAFLDLKLDQIKLLREIIAALSIDYSGRFGDHPEFVVSSWGSVCNVNGVPIVLPLSEWCKHLVGTEVEVHRQLTKITIDAIASARTAAHAVTSREAVMAALTALTEITAKVQAEAAARAEAAAEVEAAAEAEAAAVDNDDFLNRFFGNLAETQPAMSEPCVTSSAEQVEQQTRMKHLLDHEQALEGMPPAKKPRLTALTTFSTFGDSAITGPNDLELDVEAQSYSDLSDCSRPW